jgi:hypothetical protein
MKKDSKLKLHAILEANKISRLSRTLQDQKLKELKSKYEITKDKKTGIMIEILTQKMQDAEDVNYNMSYGDDI